MDYSLNISSTSYWTVEFGTVNNDSPGEIQTTILCGCPSLHMNFFFFCYSTCLQHKLIHILKVTWTSLNINGWRNRFNLFPSTHSMKLKEKNPTEPQREPESNNFSLWLDCPCLFGVSHFLKAVIGVRTEGTEHALRSVMYTFYALFLLWFSQWWIH